MPEPISCCVFWPSFVAGKIRPYSLLTFPGKFAVRVHTHGRAQHVSLCRVIPIFTCFVGWEQNKKPKKPKDFPPRPISPEEEKGLKNMSASPSNIVMSARRNFDGPWCRNFDGPWCRNFDGPRRLFALLELSCRPEAFTMQRKVKRFFFSSLSPPVQKCIVVEEVGRETTTSDFYTWDCRRFFCGNIQYSSGVSLSLSRQTHRGMRRTSASFSVGDHGCSAPALLPSRGPVVSKRQPRSQPFFNFCGEETRLLALPGRRPNRQDAAGGTEEGLGLPLGLRRPGDSAPLGGFWRGVKVQTVSCMVL